MIRNAIVAGGAILIGYLAMCSYLGLSGQRSMIIGAGIPLYAFCAALCVEGWRRFGDLLFLWQGTHLVCLCASQLFFTYWYAFGRPPLPLDIQFHLPNWINIGMGIGAFMWCWMAFNKKPKS